MLGYLGPVDVEDPGAEFVLEDVLDDLQIRQSGFRTHLLHILAHGDSYSQYTHFAHAAAAGRDFVRTLGAHAPVAVGFVAHKFAPCLWREGWMDGWMDG